MTRNTYGAKRCQMDGHSFDSLAEMKHPQDLLIRQRLGEVVNIQVHPVYPVSLHGKGVYTDLSRLKHKLFTAMCNQTVTLVRKGARKPKKPTTNGVRP